MYSSPNVHCSQLTTQTTEILTTILLKQTLKSISSLKRTLHKMSQKYLMPLQNLLPLTIPVVSTWSFSLWASFLLPFASASCVSPSQSSELYLLFSWIAWLTYLQEIFRIALLLPLLFPKLPATSTPSTMWAGTAPHTSWPIAASNSSSASFMQSFQ